MICGLSQVVISIVNTIGPVVLTQILPELLYGIELRRIRRQSYQCHVLGNPHLVRGVKTCPIPDHHYMNIRIRFFFEFSEEGIDRIGVEVGSKQAYRLTGLRARRSKNIEIVILCLTPCRRSASLWGPLPRQRTLLAESCFILKPHFYLYFRMISTDLPDLITDFFLNVSRAWGSPLGCSGREDT